MNPWISSIISVVLVSLISLIGVLTFAIKENAIKRLSTLVVSFAAGAMLGDAFFHLIPESFELISDSFLIGILIISGILLSFALEKILRWRHCHKDLSSNHVHPIASMNIVGDVFHNLLDGIIVAGSFLASPSIGIGTTMAIILHEIPQEIGDFGILIHKGIKVKKALLLNFATALSAIVGAILVLIVGGILGNLSTYLLPIAAGGFIYISSADLIPELHQECSAKPSLSQMFFLLLGIGIMIMIKLVH